MAVAKALVARRARFVCSSSCLVNILTLNALAPMTGKTYLTPEELLTRRRLHQMPLSEFVPGLSSLHRYRHFEFCNARLKRGAGDSLLWLSAPLPSSSQVRSPDAIVGGRLPAVSRVMHEFFPSKQRSGSEALGSTLLRT